MYAVFPIRYQPSLFSSSPCVWYCNRRFGREGATRATASSRSWLTPRPTCTSFSKLHTHPSSRCALYSRSLSRNPSSCFFVAFGQFGKCCKAPVLFSPYLVPPTARRPNLKFCFFCLCEASKPLQGPRLSFFPALPRMRVLSCPQIPLSNLE